MQTEPETEAPPRPTTSTVVPPTTASAATTAVTPAPAGVPSVPVWPPPGAPGFASAAQAAVDFAQNYLGMPDAAAVPVDTNRVTIRPRPDRGPATVVILETRADGSWVVRGAHSEHIRLDSPTAASTITSPVAVTGTSTAAEGTINGSVRAVGSTEALGPTAVVTGGSFDGMAPFNGTITFDPGGRSDGVLVLSEPDLSGEAAMLSATVVPVHLGG